MNILGIDYGTKRIGLAYGDELGVAVPVESIPVKSHAQVMEDLQKQIEKRNISALVIGYPLNMDSSVGFKAKEVDAFITKLEKCFGLPVYKADERLTTQQVESDLRSHGRKTKTDRKVRASGEIDSRAAALILQDYLDIRFPAS